MLKNYLKITFAVLKRRKFFTFISLFGISFTLVVLIVITAFMEYVIAAGYPEINQDRTLYIERFVELDTKNDGSSSGPLSYNFIKKYVEHLTNTEKIGFSSEPHSINTYINHQKIKLDFKYTDANFWQITNFEFLEGKPFNEQNIKNNDYVAVINDDIRDRYFGKGVSSVGKIIEVDNVHYRIIGVVRGSPIIRRFSYGDIYVPFNTTKEDYKKSEFRGGFDAMILAHNSDDFPKIKAEFRSIVSKIPVPQNESYFKPDKIFCTADTYLGTYLGQLFRTYVSDEDGDSKINFFYSLLIAFALLFMSLPAINLVNINISRIMERASEIGIRKAFGASSNALTIQFIVENIVLTLLGGIISIFLSLGVIYSINQSGLIPYLDLTINWKVFIIAMFISLVFGLLSGVYPAWRMSKLQVVDALKGAE